MHVKWIHPYWIIAATAVGIPTAWFFVSVVVPIACFLKPYCGSAAW